MKKQVIVLMAFMLLFSAFLVKVEAKESKLGEPILSTIEKREAKEDTNAQVTSSRPQEAKGSSQLKDNTQVKTEQQGVKNSESKDNPQVKVEKQEPKESNLKDYIEVDIDKQEISMYLKGKLLVQGPVVTGNVDAGRDTPTGEFSIMEKDYDVVLVGPGYASHVTYWMQIYGGVGIHDADEWRDEYGGDIYLSDGSHGCINVPFDIVETIYQNAYVGMDVIVK